MTPDVVPYTPDLAMYYAVRTLIIVLAIRDGIRKAIALRKAAGKRQIARFICLFVFNTVGLLPIIYLLFFANRTKKTTEVDIKIATKPKEKNTEEDIKKTAAKIEKLIKTTSQKIPVKKTPTKKPVAKKAPTKKTK